MSTIDYWLAALHLTDIGPVRIRRWLKHFENIEALFLASNEELFQIGLTPMEILEIKDPDWRAIDKDLLWCEQNDCQIITEQDFPILLRELHDAPLVLFARGNAQLLHMPQIAIVGSRNPTPSGRELAEQFAQTLTQAGLVITSGLALGIDTASHEGSLAAKGGTIAVLGSGLKNIYPRCNKNLSDAIIDQGLLLSEFAPSQPAKSHHFPQRNRIISGLSLGVLVIEAAIRSGSLITAQFASDQGREVFAIPGSIHNPLAKGCHWLIQNGAKLVEKSEDIVEELGALNAILAPQTCTKAGQKRADLDQKMSHFLTLVDYAQTPFDTLLLRSGLTAGEVSSMLLSLELRGYVHLVPGGYTRSSP